jgi:hypothetical protein
MVFQLELHEGIGNTQSTASPRFQANSECKSTQVICSEKTHTSQSGELANRLGTKSLRSSRTLKSSERIRPEHETELPRENRHRNIGLMNAVQNQVAKDREPGSS